MNKKYSTPQKAKLYLALLLSTGLTACGGGGNGSSPETVPEPPPAVPITSFELLDPTPGASNQFGDKVIILPNGNIVVTDPGDSSISANNGAVHLYDAREQTLIASIYGDDADDRLGGTGITALANNNFVIVSQLDDVAGLANAGSVRLVNGSTGAQIGAAIVGDNANDFIGSGGVTALANNNFVIVSQLDDVAGLTDAGSVRLINDSTGAQIGGVIVGDNVNDRIGLGGVTALANNNYVIVSQLDDVAGLTDAGSVRLVNGSTGAQIGGVIVGDNAVDSIGSGGITALANNNFVIASKLDDVGGLANAGSVRLVNGSTGAQIGAAIVGDKVGDEIGLDGVTALANNNFVIASSSDDVAGIILAGSVRLINGSTGAQIGAAIVGDNVGDGIGLGSVTALANNNYVIVSQIDDVAGLTDAGSVRLVNGSTGAQIGAVIVGDNVDDEIGNSGVTALANNNFVIASSADDVSGINNAGSVRLVSGSTGAQIGAAIVGDDAFDVIGLSGITALANNNYVIASKFDDVAGIINAGSVRLVNGSTGAQIGATIAGDDITDHIGASGITVLANNKFVIASANDDVSGIADVGSIRLMDGNTSTQIGDVVVGSVKDDMQGVSIIVPANENYYILALPNADNNGSVNSGFVRLIAP